MFVDIVEELQRHLANPNADYPVDLVEKIIEQREHVTPKLLAIVEEFLACSPRDISTEKWREGIFVFLLLAKLRERKAFPYVVRLCSMPHKLAEHYVDEFITENAHRLLASTFNGDLKELYSIVTNQYLWEYSRWVALDAYIVLYGHNLISRKEILDDYSCFFEELYDDFSLIPSQLVSNCSDIQAIELSEKIERYLSGGFIDPEYASRESVKESFSKAPGKVLEELQEETAFYDLIDDLEYKSKWLFRRDEELTSEIDYDGDEFKRAACALYARQLEEGEDGTFPIYVSTQVVRTAPKIGRNDLCSCGSGKKYKKCCLIN
jgi:hypothetical protein